MFLILPSPPSPPCPSFGTLGRAVQVQIDIIRSMHSEGAHLSDPFSHSLKKSILWNAVEPGDPYDIKKSMIAKLPGDKKIFLGNKLEIVCLLQAAEIERLALHLEEYKVKLRQTEKSELDRHSYEIQIMELAARVQGEDSMRSENAKLKHFIDRLNQELEDNRQRLSAGSTQLNTKYQQALLQVQLTTDQNSQLSTEVLALRKVLDAKSTQLALAELRIKQLEQQLLGLREDEGRMSEYEDKFELLSSEIERLNSVLRLKTEEIYDLSDRLSHADASVFRQQEENKELIGLSVKLTEELNSIKNELRSGKYEAEEYKFREYQHKLDESAREIDSLNVQLANQRQQLSNQEEEFGSEMDHLREVNVEYESHMVELQHQCEKYEGSTAMLGKEVERLNGVLRGKIDEINTLQLRHQKATEENQHFKKQINVLNEESADFRRIHNRMEELEFELNKERAAKERIAKINSDLLKRQEEFDHSKLEQYEQKTTQLTQEIMRLNGSIITLQSENRAIKERSSENEGLQGELKRLSKELTDLKSVMVQEDISKKNAQDRIVELTRKCTEYQKLINELSGEIQRLNEILRTKLQEITILDSKLQHLGGENERLEGQLRAHGDKDSKIDDYENKFALISLEVERLNSNLKLKLQQATEQEQQLAAARKDNTRLKEQLSDLSFRLNQSSQEINDLRRQLQQKEDDLSRMRGSEMKSSEYQAEIQKLNQIVKMKLDELRDRQAQIHRFQVENESLRGELRESKSRQKEVSDLERLNNLLRLKVEEATRWETSNQELIKNSENLQNNLEATLRENSSLKTQLQRLTAENGTLIEQLNEYKNKVQQILKEFERLQQMLEAFRRENGDLKRESYELKAQLTGGNLREKNQKLLEEIERLNRIVEQQKEESKELRLILSQDHAFERRIREQLSLIVILCAEIESLRKRVEEKEREVEDVRRESLVPLKA